MVPPHTLAGDAMAPSRTPPQTEDWHALVSEACRRTSYSTATTYPLSWLPRGVSWSERTDYGSNDGRGSGA